MHRPDRHNEIELNLLTTGSLTYLLGGRRTTVEAGKLGLFWAALPHQIVAVEGHEAYFVMTLPLNEFLRAGLDISLVNRVLQGELLIDSMTNESDETIFRRWEQDLRSNDEALERAALLEVQARLMRFARAIPSNSKVNSGLTLSRADQLACYIAKNYQDSLSSQLIAEANGMHPNYAMNLFQKTFGITIASFIIQHRITHAQRLLVTTNDTILDVAFASGFQSLSRFNEAFKAACGCSPRGYRNAHRAVSGVHVAFEHRGIAVRMESRIEW